MRLALASLTLALLIHSNRHVSAGEVFVWGNTSSGKTNVPPAATNLVALAAGYDHTVALRADGQVLAWGANGSGQTNVPAAATGVTQIAPGAFHNLVLRTDGTVLAWGSSANNLTAIPVPATNAPLLMLAGGTIHNVVLRTNGSVFAWGSSLVGVTNAPATATNGIRLVAGNKSVITQPSHSLLLRRDGTVIGWGLGTQGQTNPPAAATNLVAVAAGDQHSLALRADGTVIAWGNNNSGQASVPESATNVVAIAAGSAHSLALRSDGSIIAWGSNGSGQRNVPAAVSNSVSIAIAAGNSHSACLVGDGSPLFVDSLGSLVAYSNRVFRLNALAVGAPPLSYQWRFNEEDLLGETAGFLTLPGIQSSHAGRYSVVVSNAHGVVTGLIANVTVEIALEPPSVLVAPESQTVFAGTNVSFSVSAAGNPPPSYQWRFNSTNIAGGTNSTYAIPYVVTNQAGAYRVVLSNALGVVTSAVATLTVNLPDWPTFNSWPASRAVSFGSPLTLAVSVLGSGPINYRWQLNGTNLPHVGGPALTFGSFQPADGGIYRVFATNPFGESASPEFEILAVPVAAWGNSSQTNLPRSLTNAIAVSAGYAHALALRADGLVVGWGDNTAITGTFPNYTTNYYGMATVPADLNGVVAVSSGTYHNLALRSNGTVVAWGRHTSGETNVPANATNVIAVAAGDAHSLALRGDGTVVGWGANTSGQLNVLAEATNIVAIAAGAAYSVAVRGDGRIVAWGASGSIQPLPAVTNAVAISARNNFSIAINRDGVRSVWGSSTPVNGPSGVFTSPVVPMDYVGAAAGFGYALYLRAGGFVQALYGSGVTSSDARLYPPTWMSNVVAVAAGAASFAVMQPPAQLPVMQVAQRHAHLGTSAVFPTHVEGQRVFNFLSLGRYQWRFNGTDLPGATQAHFTRPVIAADHAGDYSVVITEPGGSVTSQVANLTVTVPPPPQIAAQPVSRTLGAGTNVTFTVALSYGIPGWIQWQFNELDLPGANGTSLSLTNLQAINAGGYRVVVTNFSGSVTSDVATLTITSTPPAFVAQPQNRSAAAGVPASFSALAVGTEPIAYQWFFNDAEIPGATGSSFTVLNTSPLTAGIYRVVATNLSGSVTSAPATLTLVPLMVWGGDLSPLTNPPATATNAVALALGSGHALALRANGSVVGWGDNVCGQINIPAGASNVVRIATGDKHSLALRDDGSVLAWGNNYVGQATVPAGLSNVVGLAAGAMHSIALRAEGTVVAWGSNLRSETSTPTGLTNVVAVTAGGLQTLALKRDGTLAAWGALDYVPPEATNVTAIALGFAHAVALRGDGSVVAWGSTSTNAGLSVSFGCSSYSVGGNLAVKTNLIPAPPNATNIVAIAAGRSHILALRADGVLLAWGDDSAGQTSVPAGSGFIGIAAGGQQSLALLGSPVPQLGAFRTNRTAGETMDVILHPVVGGIPPLAWSWNTSSTNAAGTNAAFLFLRNVTTNDTAAYPFVASSAHGAVTGMISLTVTTQPPAFVVQPVGALATVGSNFTATATVRGTTPMTFQWRRDDINLADGGRIAGANSATLTISNVQMADAGSCSLAATNQAGFAISSNALLQVFAESPLATALDTTNLVWTTGGPSGWHWQTATNHDGVDAAETGPFTTAQTNWVETTVMGPVVVSFWWRAFGWIPDRMNFSLDGVEQIAVMNDFDWQQRSYSVPAGLHTLRWTYVCSPFAGPSTAWLDQVTLTNVNAPAVTTHPTARGAILGSSTAFSATFTGTEPLAYQWRLDDVDLPGATNSTLTIFPVTATNAGNYRIVATNPAGSATSSPALLAINSSMPVIQTGPSSLTAAPGTSPMLTSTILGNTPMNVQWQWNRADIPNANDPTLVLTNLQPGLGGAYRVIASNELGTAISAEAQLTIVPVAAWGYNGSQQTRVPPNVGDVVGIAGGISHSSALRRDGTVVTWGSLGLSAPVQMLTGQEVFSAIGASLDHDIGLQTNGTVKVFNYVGGGLDIIPTGLSNVVAVATGGRHDLALRSDGTLAAWGLNSYGQLEVPPVATNLIAIAASRFTSLVLTDSGELLAWGYNEDGLLDVPPLGDYVDLVAGPYHALALRGDGTVIAWGYNSDGQTNVPVGLSNIVALAGGYGHSLALRADGKIIAWGDNAQGQINVPDTLTNVVAVAAGQYHTLALMGDGRPVITVPPRRRRLQPGGSATLRVFAVGNAPLQYQWRQNGTNLPGATNAVLIVSGAGNYSVSVSNAVGVVNSPEAGVSLSAPVMRFDRSPAAMFLAADGLHLRLLGLSGRGPIVVLASTDLVAWIRILTNPPIAGEFVFVDFAATNLTRRFYRAMETETVPLPTLRFDSPSVTATATGSLFGVTIKGLIGSGPVSVLGSSNLLHWDVVATNPPASGDWHFQHLQSNGPIPFWYRAVEQR